MTQRAREPGPGLQPQPPPRRARVPRADRGLGPGLRAPVHAPLLRGDDPLARRSRSTIPSAPEDAVRALMQQLHKAMIKELTHGEHDARIGAFFVARGEPAMLDAAGAPAAAAGRRPSAVAQRAAPRPRPPQARRLPRRARRRASPRDRADGGGRGRAQAGRDGQAGRRAPAARRAVQLRRRRRRAAQRRHQRRRRRAARQRHARQPRSRAVDRRQRRTARARRRPSPPATASSSPARAARARRRAARVRASAAGLVARHPDALGDARRRRAPRQPPIVTAGAAARRSGSGEVRMPWDPPGAPPAPATRSRPSWATTRDSTR